VLDPDEALRDGFDPLGEGPERALVPHITFVRAVEELRDRLADEAYCGVLLREPARFELTHLREAVLACRTRTMTVVLDLSDADLSGRAEAPILATTRPDLVVLGEGLTGAEVPFGAFVGTEATFEVWTRPGNAFLHTNTYGGNKLALRKVRAGLLRRFEPGSPVLTTVARAESDRDLVLDLYGRHVNAATAKVHRMLRGALNIVRAEGARVTVELDSGRRLDLVDGVSGGGLGVGGHNPDDARTEVLRGHDPDTDYTAKLEGALARETGLARTFPGVSGASAVETALTLALLAQRQGQQRRRRIIVFDHNYGGKTLIALLATAAAGSREPFAPLYDGVRYLDPFAPDAAERLHAELASNEVALVWLELVHGSSDSYATLPADLLGIVARERERQGFLVGVDEILTSFYRCGPRFAFHGRLPEVDLMTVSKALSYLCFPVSAAVVSESVYERARAANPRLVDELKERYAHPLGAHFAVHSLAQVDALDLAGRSAALANDLCAAVAAVDAESRTIGRRFIEGLFVRLEMKPPQLPGRLADRAGELSMISVILWWITRARVFVLYDCFGPHQISGPEEAARITEGIRALATKSPYGLLRDAAAFLATEAVLSRWNGRRRRRRAGAFPTPSGTP
jgi:adenosylmethionine-8-amino-7-oxononanoate aminotransferase